MCGCCQSSMTLLSSRVSSMSWQRRAANSTKALSVCMSCVLLED